MQPGTTSEHSPVSETGQSAATERRGCGEMRLLDELRFCGAVVARLGWEDDGMNVVLVDD